MDDRRDTMLQRAGRAALAGSLALGMAVVMTWPLAAGLGHLGRTTSDDGRYAIWNVAWVAHTLTEQPLQLFDANIFHPHPLTLAYSEINLVAGLIAIPGWLLTANPYVAHNLALLFAFSSSAVGAWLLARHLCGDGAAALPAAVAYAFCPYFFGHSPHIQLLMGGGIPLALLMVHRLAEQPSRARGAWLGLTLGVQALACAYYGILAGLMVGYAALFLAASRGLWRSRVFWEGLGAGAVVSAVLVVPFFIPYLEIVEGGFARTLDDSRRYSANLASYLASPAHLHRPLLTLSNSLLGRWNEVLFPGVTALLLGGTGFVLALRGGAAGKVAGPVRETALLYASLGALTIWASFGPDAGLYTVLYEFIPLFSFLRAPSRFGVVIPLILGIFAALALVRLPSRLRTRAGIAAALLTAVELNVLPFPWERAPVVPRPYQMLARLPKAPVAEFPFYGGRVAFPLHTQYMLFSTSHWQPLVNGYSDHIPAEWRQAAAVLDGFPSHDGFAVLRRYRVRYIGVHWDMYVGRAQEIRERLQPFMRHLRELSSDDRMTLYEVVSFP